MIPGFGDISGGQGGIQADLGATNGDFTGGADYYSGPVVNVGSSPWAGRTSVGPVQVDNSLLFVGLGIAAFLLLRKKK